ncbi:hypothetical protein G6F70_004145 [Rhizopus microsporus]|nr:hypothetical protein G6F71_004183 [Rhizopus microsporus]KAG1200326.1 hypothetical protein G6F70_004145 [Rhizopus microsporus]KAG1214787.1 hypothetical protein G6F69_001613 [Rhizopus microsporus]KAG1233917.1 hypothetical protein G6F67_003912 [Rhizopus microsporus]KAG1258383.1 hypothetical protein G6F68_008801 [Rhizopus microsporus]
MEETPSADMRITIKRYARDIHFYDDGFWTRSEVTNKSFVSYLKRYKMDAHSTTSQNTRMLIDLDLLPEQLLKFLKIFIKNHGGDQTTIRSDHGENETPLHLQLCQCQTY